MIEDHFDRLETELRLATARVARRSIGTKLGAIASRGSRPRVRWSGPLLVVNAAVVIAVAVGFIALLDHHHAAVSAPTARTPVTVHWGHGGPAVVLYAPGADPSLRALVRNFAILRRSQTAADRSWRPECGCGDAAHQLYRYTRYVTTLRGGDRVFFDLEQFTFAGQDNLPADSYLMNIDLVERNGNTSSSSFGPNTQFTIFPFNASGDLQLSAVPDGVATVTWRFACQGTLHGCAGVHPRTVTVPARHNLAAARVPDSDCRPARSSFHRHGSGFTARPPVCLRSRGTTWRAADGRILVSFPGYANLAAPPFITGGRGNRPLRVLGPQGIGEARLGAQFTAAEQTLTALLGRPAVTGVAVPGCSAERESVWSSPATALPLTVYDRDGRFSAYQYGAPVSTFGLLRGPGAILLTPQGLTLNDTVAVARRRYGTAFSAHATGGQHTQGGGQWRVATEGGSLHGALLPVRYPMRTVTPATPIATIVAGETSCPSSGH